MIQRGARRLLTREVAVQISSTLEPPLLSRQLRRPSSRTTLPATARPLIRAHFTTSPRCQSEAGDQVAAEGAKESDPGQGAGASEEAVKPASEEAKPEQEEDPIKKELEAKTREALDWRDKYLRSVAEYRNLLNRTKREVADAKQFAIQKFASDLMESVDTFDLALSNVPIEKLAPISESDGGEDPNKDLRQLHGGLRMTETILMNTLKKHGLERFDPSETAEKFDPNKHEATFMAPQPGKEDGSVFHTTQKGFLLNGRVVRAAKVGVVKNS